MRKRKKPLKIKPPAAPVSCMDANLIMEVERARYRQKDFSDSHWANLLLATYRACCATGHSPVVDALTDILRTYCTSSATAKDKAADYAARGCPLPTWIKLKPGPDWANTCHTIQTRGIKFGPNGEFLCLLGDGD